VRFDYENENENENEGGGEGERERPEIDWRPENDQTSSALPP
jgi:hypothetical protein